MPFMNSDRWPDDIVFMVFEEDMEFFPGGVIPGRDPAAVSSAGVSEHRVHASQTSPFAKDLMTIMIAAHRIGYGDFVWAGHQPKGEPQAKRTKVTWMSF